jgi:hypothetical protein
MDFKRFSGVRQWGRGLGRGFWKCDWHNPFADKWNGDISLPTERERVIRSGSNFRPGSRLRRDQLVQCVWRKVRSVLPTHDAEFVHENFAESCLIPQRLKDAPEQPIAERDHALGPVVKHDFEAISSEWFDLHYFLHGITPAA